MNLDELRREVDEGNARGMVLYAIDKYLEDDGVNSFATDTAKDSIIDWVQVLVSVCRDRKPFGFPHAC